MKYSVIEVYNYVQVYQHMHIKRVEVDFQIEGLVDISGHLSPASVGVLRIWTSCSQFDLIKKM